MLAFGMPGMTEWIVILIIIMMFFGLGKLPDVMAQAGKGLRAFKDASDGKDAEPPKDGQGDPPRSARQLGKDTDELDDPPEAGVAPRRERARDA